MSEKRRLTPLEQDIATRRGFKPRDYEKFPEISIRYLNISHETEGDVRGFVDEIKSADVLVLEDAEHTPGAERELLNIVTGKIPRDRFDLMLQSFTGVDASYVRKLYGLLYNIQKPVVCGDYTKLDTQLVEMRKKADDLHAMLRRGTSKQEVLKRYLSYAQAQVAFDVAREKHIVQILPSKLSRAFKDFPLLLKKNNLVCLLPYGAMHSDMYRMIKKIHSRSTAEFPFSPYSFTHYEEFERKVRFGVSYTETDLERAYIDKLYGGMIRNMVSRQSQEPVNDEARRAVLTSLNSEELDLLIKRTIQRADPVEIITILGPHIESVRNRLLADKK